MSYDHPSGPTDHPPYTPPPYQPSAYGFQQQQQYPAGTSSNSMAIPALVLGILALPLGWIPFLGWPLPILATVFGALGISRARATPDRAGYSQSVAGLVCGIIAIVLALILMAAIMLDDDEDDDPFRDRSRTLTAAAASAS